MFFKLNIGSLKSILLKQKVLDEATADIYDKSASGEAVPLEHWLVSNELITKNEIYTALENEYNISYFDLSNHIPDLELLSKLNHSILIETNSFPISLSEGNLKIAMSEPLNIFHLDKIQSSVDFKIAPFFSIPRHIEAKHQELLKDNIIEDDFKTLLIKEESNNMNSYSIYSDEDIVGNDLSQLLSSLFSTAAHQMASDIHFDPKEKDVNVRFRIDGNLKEIMKIPSKLYPNIVSKVKLLSSLNISIKRIPQDGSFNLDIDGRNMDIRSSFIPTIFGEKMVLRLMDGACNIINLDSLGIDKNECSLIKNIIHRRQGLILITGPTGSGKTTTLYSILNELNSNEVNIITIEDPVEQKLKGLNQIQVNSSIGLGFEKVLRHVLRQDPDIIMVGEIRDLETAKLAISAAITGHMVLSTLHTEDSASAVLRLMDMGIETHLIISSLRAVISQRLFRKNCKLCLVKDELEVENSEYFSENKIERSYKSIGCEKCNNSGCIGREPILEILEFNDKIVDVFKEKKSIVEIRKSLKEINHQTLKDKFKDKVNSGEVELKEYIKLFGI